MMDLAPYRRMLGAAALAVLAWAIPPGADAQAPRDGTVAIYSATDTDAMVAVIAGFEAAHPGLTVEYTEYQTSDLYEDVGAGRTGQADVIVSSAMDLQAALVNAGLAIAFDPGAQNVVPDWAHWRDELYGFTYEPITVIFNRAAFQGRALPRTRSEVATMIREDPDFFAGRIGTYDIRRSGVGYMFATQDVARGYQIWRLVETFGRAGTRTYCCTSELLDEVASGNLVFAYNVIGSYALAHARRDDRVGVYVLEDYALVMTRGAFVPKTAPNPQGGMAFIAYVLSPEGQRLIDERSALISLSNAVNPGASRVLAPLGSLESMLPIRLGPGLLAYLDQSKRARFLEDWDNAMGSGEP